jgi:hypothetical protein
VEPPLLLSSHGAQITALLRSHCDPRLLVSPSMTRSTPSADLCFALLTAAYSPLIDDPLNAERGSLRVVEPPLLLSSHGAQITALLRSHRDPRLLVSPSMTRSTPSADLCFALLGAAYSRLVMTWPSMSAVLCEPSSRVSSCRLIARRLPLCSAPAVQRVCSTPSVDPCELGTRDCSSRRSARISASRGAASASVVSWRADARSAPLPS